ncbi:unnamed protein product, partial [Rotaria sp. Silwood1]
EFHQVIATSPTTMIGETNTSSSTNLMNNDQFRKSSVLSVSERNSNSEFYTNTESDPQISNSKKYPSDINVDNTSSSITSLPFSNQST